jgi:methionyl-tRNA formyltransferase
MSFRIVFMGTPQFAVPSLEALVRAGHSVVLCVCQPDAAAGRRPSELQPPPVKLRAQELGLEVFQPKGLRLPKNQEPVRRAAPDLIVVAAYGKILPKEVLEIPSRGCINVHGSLLPELRGAAPIQWAIARGKTETGVTTMLMDQGMDTGPILLQRSIPIGPRETAPELSERMARLGAELLIQTVELWEAGRLRPTPQPSAGVTYAPVLRKEDGYLNWSAPAWELACRVRGFWPWPGAVCKSPAGASLKVHRASAEQGSGAPGVVLAVRDDGILVGTGSGALLIEELQPESRKRMRASEFARGARLSPGERFGQFEAPVLSQSG